MKSATELAREIARAATVDEPGRFPRFDRPPPALLPADYAPSADVKKATRWAGFCRDGLCVFAALPVGPPPQLGDTTVKCPGLHGALHLGPPRVLRWRKCDRALAWDRKVREARGSVKGAKSAPESWTKGGS